MHATRSIRKTGTTVAGGLVLASLAFGISAVAGLGGGAAQARGPHGDDTRVENRSGHGADATPIDDRGGHGLDDASLDDRGGHGTADTQPDDRGGHGPDDGPIHS